MNNKMPNMAHFKVKCIYIDNDCLTVSKEYDVIEVDVRELDFEYCSAEINK